MTPSDQEPTCNCVPMLYLIWLSLKQIDKLDQTHPVTTLKRLFESQFERIVAQHEKHLHPTRPAGIIPLSYEERNSR